MKKFQTSENLTFLQIGSYQQGKEGDINHHPHPEQSTTPLKEVSKPAKRTAGELGYTITKTAHYYTITRSSFQSMNSIICLPIYITALLSKSTDQG